MAPISIKEESDFSASGCKALLEGAQLFVDAVLGTGFHPPMRGLAVAGRKTPGGLSQDTRGRGGSPLRLGRRLARSSSRPEAYRADAVVTFTAPKLAHVSGMLTRGPIVVAPIGSPSEAVESATGLTWAGASKVIADRPRSPNSNKGQFGHVLVIGGARGKSGAPSMSSVAALRTGAGLVTAAVAQSILPTVAAVTPGTDDHGSARRRQGRNLQPEPGTRLSSIPFWKRNRSSPSARVWGRRRKRSNSSWA